MKNLFTLSLALLGGLAAQAQTLYPGNIAGCIARYDMNTTASGTVTTVPDMSGNSNHSSSTTNLVTAPDFRGHPNKSVVFDGISSYVAIPTSPTLEPNNAITMIAVVNPYAFYAGVCQGTTIVDKGNVDNTPGAYYMRFSDNPSDGENCYAFDPMQQQTVSAFGPAWYYAPPITPYIVQHSWYFIAVTYNGDVVNVYQVPMDPQSKQESISPVGTYPLTGTIGTNSNDLLIGKHNSTTHPYWFNGAMDEVALFNRGLSNAEVYKIYSYLWGATLAVDNNELLSDIDVHTYPNPAQNEWNISGKFNSANTVQLEVYNTIGQKVLAESIATNAGNLQHKVNTANLPAGIYIAKLTADGAIQTTKFSIQR